MIAHSMQPVLVAAGEDPRIEIPPITQWEDEKLIEDALQRLSARMRKEIYQRRIIREFSLSERAVNRLLRYNIETIGQLVRYSRARLLNLPTVGVKVVEELESALHTVGLSLATE